MELRSTKATTRAWIFIACYAALLSILRGIRFPGSWVYSQHLLTYDSGFVRRGLSGTLLHSLFGDLLYSHQLLYYFSVFTCLTTLILIISLCILLIKRDEKFTVPVLVFLTSPAFVFLNHLIGYHDLIGLFCTILFLLFYHRLPNIIYSFLYIVLLSALFLLHEGQVILWGGVMTIFTMSKLLPKESCSWIDYLKSITAPLIAIVILCVIHSAFIDLTSEQIQSIVSEAKDKSSFHVRKDYFNMMVGDSNRTRKIMIHFWKQKQSFVFLWHSLSLHILPFCFLIYSYFSLNRSKNILLKTLATIAALSPIVLYLYGFDLYRWNSHVVISAFLLFFFFSYSENNSLSGAPSSNSSSDTSSSQSAQLHLPTIITAACIIMMNLSASNHFFDRYSQELFPYRSYIYYFQNLSDGKTEFPYAPDH